jgi:hypothetical protein
MNLVKSNDVLILFLFWEITENGNYLLLDQDYSDTKQYTTEQQEVAYGTWLKLWDDYFEMENNRKNKNYLIKRKSQIALLHKINTLYNIMQTLAYLQENKDVLSVEDFKAHELKFYNIVQVIAPNFKPLYFDGIPTNIYNIDRIVRGVESTYKIKFKEEAKLKEQVKQNRFREIAQVSKVLTMPLDAKKITVNEWLAYREIANEQVEAQKISRNGK